MARHTFATTITLAKGVPIETVSKMLGHTNIETTQIYARIRQEVRQIVEDEITRIKNDPDLCRGITKCIKYYLNMHKITNFVAVRKVKR